MSKQLINIGSSPNDGTGDNLRNSFIKINNNFNEVYAFSGTTGGTSGTSGINGTSGTSGSGGGGGGGVTNVTYSGLTELIDNSELIIGSQYLITDYQTVHIIPNASHSPHDNGNLLIGIQYTIPALTSGDDFSNVGYVADGVPFLATDIIPTIWINGTNVYDYLYTGNIEPLLVTASSVNTLKPEAYSLLYSEDIIYYNIVNDQTLAPGCAKGYIYRRIDTLQNNDIPFDFREVKFRRWQLNVTNIWDSGTTYNTNNVVTYNNHIFISLINDNTDDVSIINIYNNTNNHNWDIFLYDNLTFYSYSTNQLSTYKYNIPCNNSIYIDYNIWSNLNYYIGSKNNLIISSQYFQYDTLFSLNTVIFGYGFCNNILDQNLSKNNNIGSYFQYNNIESYFQYNIIKDSFAYNNIEYSFAYNNIESNFNNNKIMNNFASNRIKSNFQYNNIGNIFSSNFIESNFNNNNIESNFNNNILESNFSYNTIESYFTNNYIESNFQYNIIKSNFGGNTINSYFGNNNISYGFNYNIIGISFEYNSIEYNFNSNAISDNFQYNTIEYIFSSSTIGNNFNNNIIGNNFSSNIISNYFNNNIIENYFSSNTISNYFQCNTIGYDFTSNTIGDTFTNNTIKTSFYSNTIGTNFQMNEICDNFGGLDFTSATHVYLTYTKELFINSDSTQKLIFDKMTIVDANA